MPVHPLGKDWRVCLAEDREAFVLADELGFVEGYAGEHATDRGREHHLLRHVPGHRWSTA